MSRAHQQSDLGLLTWAVCRYCNIKYQSWAGVSSSRNWKPAEVMQGGSPGSVLDTWRGTMGQVCTERPPAPPSAHVCSWFISRCTPLSCPSSTPSNPDLPGHSVWQRPKEMAKPGAVVPRASSPLHEPSLAEELSQVLADGCTGGAHHEVQDHLRNGGEQRCLWGPREAGA